MLKSKTYWNFLNEKQIEETSTHFNRLQVTPIVQQLLMQRGITSDAAAEKFLYPKLDDLYEPSLLYMLDKAVERINVAIENNEQILVYGDYDADGVCSTVVLLKALQERGANCDYYIPNRFTEGYGPNEAAFKQIAENGYSVIITVDCGIAAFKEAEAAASLGIDLIITDHHDVQNDLPKAFAVINPKSSEDYPFKELAGVGVAWKLAQQLLGYMPDHLLDFVAIGSIADLVPLREENRILAYHGLNRMQSTKNEGLKALKEISGLKGNLTSEDIGFVIGPRINAVGRIADASLAVELFMTNDGQEAADLAMEVDALNKERQKIVNDIVKEADAQVDPTKEHEVIIVMQEGWNEGVVGIVASRLVEKYNRPTVVLSINHDAGTAKGSARSIQRLNLFDACMERLDLFINFGGHSQAAGMTLALESVEQLREHLNEYINKHLSTADFQKEMTIHQSMDIEDVNESLVAEIDQLQPFGMKNEKPTFHIEAYPTNVRMLGANKNHLKIQMKQNNSAMECIGFHMDHYDLYVLPEAKVSVIGELGINEWNGNRTVQMIIQDLKVKEPQLFDYRGKEPIDLSLYFNQFSSNLVLSNDMIEKKVNHSNVEWKTFNDVQPTSTHVETMYVIDMPHSIKQFQTIVNQVNPDNILFNFKVSDSLYLKPFPTREHFKRIYAYIFKKQSIKFSEEMNRLSDFVTLDQETTRFILDVFADMQFISITNDTIEIIEQSGKSDLTESTIYQARKERVAIEKVLYYSNYEQLMQFIKDCRKSPEEEVVHGL